MTRTIAAAFVAALALGAAAHADGHGGVKPGVMLGVEDAAVTQALTEKGFEVRKIEREDGEFEVYALRDGTRYEIYIDPETGEILKVKEDD